MNEWIEMALRWTHVFAGIMWVGATFFFTWLDGRFVEMEENPAKPGEKSEKNVWKWEAGITWITGILLFGLMFYHGGKLIEFEDAPISKGAAIWLSFGMILGAWVIYDLIWKFCKIELLGVVICYALVVATSWICCKYFSGRGAYLQLGTMMGTIMAANVWMRILPSQRRMVAALKSGKEPNLEEGARAKNRSKHNTFIVIPVVFIMISNHYPITYGSPHNWLVLSVLVLVGWAAAKIIRKA